jgi:hypothetical protein
MRWSCGGLRFFVTKATEYSTGPYNDGCLFATVTVNVAQHDFRRFTILPIEFSRGIWPAAW